MDEKVIRDMFENLLTLKQNALDASRDVQYTKLRLRDPSRVDNAQDVERLPRIEDYLVDQLARYAEYRDAFIIILKQGDWRRDFF